jgi:DNA-binding transcriptional regulator YhcF (GntR family)
VPKRSLEVHLDVSVDRTSEVPLHRQVYLGIRRLVLTGRLSPGSRLPSTRHLANDLRLSRTTVLDAFEQLIFEGYLEGKVGSGTRISSHIPHDVHTLASATQQNPIPIVRRKPRIARRALANSLRHRPAATPARPFRPGLPDISSLPLELWSRLTAKHWRRAADELYEHADSLGYLPLRKAICDYVSRSRAVRCDPDQSHNHDWSATSAISLCENPARCRRIGLDGGSRVPPRQSGISERATECHTYFRGFRGAEFGCQFGETLGTSNDLRDTVFSMSSRLHHDP